MNRTQSLLDMRHAMAEGSTGYCRISVDFLPIRRRASFRRRRTWGRPSTRPWEPGGPRGRSPPGFFSSWFTQAPNFLVLFVFLQNNVFIFFFFQRIKGISIRWPDQFFGTPLSQIRHKFVRFFLYENSNSFFVLTAFRLNDRNCFLPRLKSWNYETCIFNHTNY